MAEAATLLFCDQVHVDPGSGKVTLLGIFTELRPTRYPSPFRQFAVFGMLQGNAGENGLLRLICRSTVTNEEILQYQKNLIFSREQGLPFILQMGEFRFPQAGWYRFDLEFAGITIASNVLLLHEAV